MENKIDSKINKYFFLAAIIVFGMLLLWSLMQFFTAFLGAVMFYVLSKPCINFLLKRKWKRSLIATLIMLVSFFIILLPIAFLITLLYSKVLVVAQKPEIIVEPIKHFGDIIEQRYNISLLKGNMGKIQETAASLVSGFLNSGINFFTTITMMYFFLYFMIVNYGKLEAAIVLFLPFKRSKLEIFGNELKAQTISNALGVPLIALVHGILAFIAYQIVGMKEAAFWGVITGFCSVIPIVGTALIWLPASIYLFAKGNTWQGAFLFAWGNLVIGVSDNLIRFLLAKKMADVHPIVTVLGVIIGLKYFGITGLIFGPLIISYFIILLRIYYIEYQKPQQQLKRKQAAATNYFTWVNSLLPKKK
jgi:predicted PurR-regulated permease PerM